MTFQGTLKDLPMILKDYKLMKNTDFHYTSEMLDWDNGGIIIRK